MTSHSSGVSAAALTSALVKGALDLAVYVIDENIKEHWSQYRHLRDTTCHQLLGKRKLTWHDNIDGLRTRKGEHMSLVPFNNSANSCHDPLL